MVLYVSIHNIIIKHVVKCILANLFSRRVKEERAQHAEDTSSNPDWASISRVYIIRRIQEEEAEAFLRGRKRKRSPPKVVPADEIAYNNAAEQRLLF